jgi:hypothetical protein
MQMTYIDEYSEATNRSVTLMRVTRPEPRRRRKLRTDEKSRKKDDPRLRKDKYG